MKAARREHRVAPGKGRRAPMQPIVLVGNVIRFQENAVVSYMMEHASELLVDNDVMWVKGSIDLNKLFIATQHVHRDDWVQFAQLIGYSVSGFGDLNYVDKQTVREADAAAAKIPMPKRRTR
jgi:hypothetical protein